MRYVLDRFEGDTAVIEVTDEQGIKCINVPSSLVHHSAAEGDALIRSGEMFLPHKDETRSLRRRMRQKLPHGEEK